MAVSNIEYPALRPAGFHDIGVGDIERIFIEPFGVAGFQRVWLYERFKAWFEAIEGFGIPFELWIDGSFATHKPEPGDIDIVCIIDRDDILALEPEAAARLKELLRTSGVKRKYFCHVFPILKGDKGSYDYWMDKFGYDRSRLPKGLFRIFIGGNI